MEKIFDEIDTKTFEKFEKSIKEVLSIYLINSANEQGLIDDKMKDYIIRNIWIFFYKGGLEDWTYIQ